MSSVDDLPSELLEFTLSFLSWSDWPVSCTCAAWQGAWRLRMYGRTTERRLAIALSELRGFLSPQLYAPLTTGWLVLRKRWAVQYVAILDGLLRPRVHASGACASLRDKTALGLLFRVCRILLSMPVPASARGSQASVVLVDVNARVDPWDEHASEFGTCCWQNCPTWRLCRLERGVPGSLELVLLWIFDAISIAMARC